MNEKNLIPLSARTKSEAREISKKGGKASGVSRRKKKLMKELAKSFLNAPVPRSGERKLKAAGFSDDELVNSALILLGIFKKAVKGDVRAAEFLRDMAGENPQIEFKRELLNAGKVGKETSSAMLQLVETLKGD